MFWQTTKRGKMFGHVTTLSLINNSQKADNCFIIFSSLSSLSLRYLVINDF